MSILQEYQRLRSLINSVVRIARTRKREEASISLGSLLILGGVYLSDGLAKVGLTDFFAYWYGDAIVRISLMATGLSCVAYGVYKIFRLVYVPHLSPEKSRPSAIKGPMAFTEADGDLFRKLGRESELQTLLGLMLDDQVSMVVVRGASGAGKTSLLRAGLKHILGDSAVFHYWEAIPTDADKGLLYAIREKWPENITKPETLDELVNPIDSLGRHKHVIVLDQFEQLQGSKKIFQFLRRLLRESKPPYRITWVIAFRREFSADWLDFVSPEMLCGVGPPKDIALSLFTFDQARTVISQLVNESNLKDSVEQSVINNLVEAATVKGYVSPVDVGIGLLVLAELQERQNGKTFSIDDYQFVGGAEGILTQYIRRCLELFPKENQEIVLKAMLALRNADTNQRLAEGKTLDELAEESSGEVRVLKVLLNRLSNRDIRLLEIIRTKDNSTLRYRLPHDRLILALKKLTGDLPAGVDQAREKFNNSFQSWKIDKSAQYLLKSRDLKLIERYETQIPWGADEQEKKNFMARSKLRRRYRRVAVAAVGLGFIILCWMSVFVYKRLEHKLYLRESGYPLDLYFWQHHITKLTLSEGLDLDRFTWISSDSIEQLTLKASNSSISIAGLQSLSECYSVTNLHLDLGDSEVRNLDVLSNLTNLTHLNLKLGNGLYLEDSEVQNLNALSTLTNLTHLTLIPNSHISNVDVLSKLTNLTYLDLNISLSGVTNLDALSKLTNLTYLKLEMDESNVISLDALSKLTNLTHLYLDTSSSNMINIDALSTLTNLTSLDLNIGKSSMIDLGALSKLTRLTSLSLELDTISVNNLKALSNLTSLTSLNLQIKDSYDSSVSLSSLVKLARLTKFSLDIYSPSVIDLAELAKLSNLTELILSFSEIKVSNLELLQNLTNLTHLTVSFPPNWSSNLEWLPNLTRLTNLILICDYWPSPASLPIHSENQVSNLDGLSRYTKLTHLTLGLGTEVKHLDVLSMLPNLTSLALDITHTSEGHLDALSKLTSLTNLTLNLRGTELNNLKWLSKLIKLTNLKLSFNNSAEIDVDDLTKLANLTTLDLEFHDYSQLSNPGDLSKLTHLHKLSIAAQRRGLLQSLLRISPSVRELELEFF